jgi:hypothetical protein
MDLFLFDFCLRFIFFKLTSRSRVAIGTQQQATALPDNTLAGRIASFSYGRSPACSIAFFFRPKAGSLLQLSPAVTRHVQILIVNAGKD